MLEVIKNQKTYHNNLGPEFGGVPGIIITTKTPIVLAIMFNGTPNSSANNLVNANEQSVHEGLS